MTKHTEKILAFLFRQGPATRTQIAETLHIRKGTVGELCQHLLDAEMIQSEAADRKRDVKLRLAAESFRVVGVDHREDGLAWVVLDADRRVVDEGFATLTDEGGPPRMRLIEQIVKDLVVGATGQPGLLGIGFCDIGMVDVAAGCSVRSEMLPGWEGIPLQAPLERATGLPVRLLGKAPARCIAEHGMGSGRDRDTFAYALADRVIGFAALIRGRLLRGDSAVFGELGHIVVDPAGQPCLCGNRGCLETIAGTDAILRKYQLHLDAGRHDRPTPSAREVLERSVAGDKPAYVAVREAGAAFGNAVAQVLTVLGLRRLVIGGELAETGEIFFDAVAEAIRQRCVAPLNNEVELVAATVSSHHAAACGAACYALYGRFRRADSLIQELIPA